MKSIIWLKSRIKFIALTTKKVVAIDFYRLNDIIDINKKRLSTIVDSLIDFPIFFLSIALVGL